VFATGFVGTLVASGGDAVAAPAVVGGGGRWRHFTPVDEQPVRKKEKRRAPEIVIKEDVVIETVYVDFAGIVGTVEQLQAELLNEEKRIEARRKRAKNKALILMMLS
jgi:hypothetical protein